MVKKIESLNNHIIVVGYGRVGQLAVSELKKAEVDFVVIDDDFKEFDVTQSKEDILKVFGDATEDETLIRAGITKAKGMIVATGNAATNVFVVLSAKELNPSIFIVARVEDETSTPKLIKAGADRTVNPYYIGGQRLANLIVNPNIVDFFETNFHIGSDSLTLESIRLEDSSSYSGKSIRELNIRQTIGATIIAVVRGDKSFTIPDADFVLNAGDQVLFMGTREQIKKIQAIK
jgi:voltage-gated potassium channel